MPSGESARRCFESGPIVALDKLQRLEIEIRCPGHPSGGGKSGAAFFLGAESAPISR